MTGLALAQRDPLSIGPDCREAPISSYQIGLRFIVPAEFREQVGALAAGEPEVVFGFDGIKRFDRPVVVL